MGLYADRVLPHLVERTCGVADLRPWREQAVAGLTGTVLEIGFGSGLNVAHYPAAVTRVLAVEPSEVARRIAAPRIAASRVPVEVIGLRGESIPLPDDVADSALSTFTLCTIPDVPAALAEVRRVLRPGGRLHVLEHGLAPAPGVARWQRRIDHVWPHVAGGCHLGRPTVELLRAAGFTELDVEQRFAPGPKPWVWMTVGTATLTV